MKKLKCNRAAEYSALGKLLSFLLKKPVNIKDVENPEDLGYTKQGNPITLYVAWKHELYKGLSECEKKMMRKGIAFHEFGHQKYTNFVYWNSCVDKRPKEEQSILHQYLNILEDCGIEYILTKSFTGTIRKALLFTIKTVYDNQCALEDIPNSSPLTEYISALIMLGDVGVVKGSFQFPEAKKAFGETVETFFYATRNPNGRARIDAGVEIFEKTKYLWKQAAEDAKTLQDFLDMLKELGVNDTSGSGAGENADIDENAEPTEADKNASTTITRIKKSLSSDDNEDSGNDGSESDGKPSAGKSSEESDSGDGSDNEEKSGKKSEKGTEEDTGNDSGDKNSSGSDTKDDDSGNEEETKDSSENKKSGRDASSESNSSEDGSLTEGSCQSGTLTSSEFDWSEYVMSEEDFKTIEKEIETETQNYEKERENDRADNAPLVPSDDIPEIGRCLNTRVSTSSGGETLYNSIVSSMVPQIRRTTKILKDIFATDREKRYNAPSGKLKANSLYITGDYITRNGSITPNIFEKRDNPKNKSDFAVAIAVDESGSMGCRCLSGCRYELARNCAIAFAEIFNDLKIPVYIMGFSADEKGYDTTHYHYVTWKNSKLDRQSLLDISDRSNNRDGASIRYLTKILNKKQAKNKLLIVISDGAPAAFHYENGEADTARAVREASSKFPVLGVSIGNSNEEILANFYKQNFLVVKNGDDLFLTIASKLKKMLK